MSTLALLLASQPAWSQTGAGGAAQSAGAGSQGAVSGMPVASDDTASTASGQAGSTTGTADSAQDASVTQPETGRDEIIVTGVRQSLANAQNIKRNADTVVDAITAEDIG
ncbi:hypothetical protein, partial [uncultured Sphingomonas sp.]|uniref:hypothetical protein n=1 Tax=uncultured Sphingomonas sp. TaxID=158754 RepID=UPI0026055DFF